MSLHYLVKLEMLIAHIELLKKETPELIPPHWWPPNSPDLNSVDYSLGDTAREGVQNTHH